MLIALWGLNNIIAHRLLTTCCKVPSDSYHYQTTNNFEKLLALKDVENISMITAPIFLVFHIYIRPTRLLENGTSNAEFDVERRFYPRSIGLDWDKRGKIKKTIIVNKNNKNEKDLQEKNSQLKWEKQC